MKQYVVNCILDVIVSLICLSVINIFITITPNLIIGTMIISLILNPCLTFCSFEYTIKESCHFGIGGIIYLMLVRIL